MSPLSIGSIALLRARVYLALLSVSLGLTTAITAAAQTTADALLPAPNGAALVRLLGPYAAEAFGAPGARVGQLHAQVVLPGGMRARDVGLDEMAPGFARFTGSRESLVSFAEAHPDLRVELAPPLHTLLHDAARHVFSNEAIAQGLDGTGALVGIADTGLDVTHPDFLDAQGHTRVAWLLDLSAGPMGLHPRLEKQFGTPASGGGRTVGAVWSGADIDAAIAAGHVSMLPRDEVGHGTLVASCAAGNGSSSGARYRGVAPGATILFARITASGTGAIDTDDMLRGVAFIFDRASAMGKPVVVNLSLGSDFGPHDGTMAWEQMLASYVGPDHPGRALVAAAGNSGSISPSDGPLVHQNVHVNDGTTMRLAIPTRAVANGGIQIWVAIHGSNALRVGLDGPDGRWISPVSPGQSAGHSSAGYAAAVYNGNEAHSPVPARSHGAVVAWQGAWPGGTYAVTLEGSGTADLYVNATGDALSPDGLPAGFTEGVREGTINLPATHPGIIGVGCTINRTAWLDSHHTLQPLRVPVLDGPGGVARGADVTRGAVDGEPCWFSSAGPTLTGVSKPEIMAPGAPIEGSLSQQAVPPSVGSIFNSATCNGTAGAVDHCAAVDPLHGVSEGTSFSAPIVAGAVAVLLQRDPTLTQDAVLAALQGGAHRLRGPAPFDDQAGVGELDVMGALAAVDRLRDPVLAIPARRQSWITLGADEYLADGSTPLQAVLELRSAQSTPADGFATGRLAVYALVDGRPLAGAVETRRRGPGVWVATVNLPAGLGSSSLTVGATFDGDAVVAPKTILIATDVWSAEYSTALRGGCAVSVQASGSDWPFRIDPFVAASLGLSAFAMRRWSRRSSAVLIRRRAFQPTKTRLLR